MRHIIGNYFMTQFGWRRFVTLNDFTLRWLELNTVELHGGPLDTAGRDKWLKAGRY